MRYTMVRLILILIVVSVLLVAWVNPWHDGVKGEDPYPAPETYPPPATMGPYPEPTEEPPIIATATKKPKKDDGYRPTDAPPD
jgi:hypothetical protein